MVFVDPVVKEAPGSGTPGKVAAGNMAPGRLAPEWEAPGGVPSDDIVAWFQFIKNSKILKLYFLIPKKYLKCLFLRLTL